MSIAADGDEREGRLSPGVDGGAEESPRPLAAPLPPRASPRRTEVMTTMASVKAMRSMWMMRRVAWEGITEIDRASMAVGR